jgi:hypothetical protein
MAGLGTSPGVHPGDVAPLERVEVMAPKPVVSRCSKRQPLLDYLVGASEQRRRHLDAERACGRQVDDQLELSRLHDLGASWAPLVRGSHPSTLSLCRVVHHSIFAHPTYATGQKHGLASTRPNHGRSAAPPIAAVVGPHTDRSCVPISDIEGEQKQQSPTLS